MFSERTDGRRRRCYVAANWFYIGPEGGDGTYAHGRVVQDRLRDMAARRLYVLDHLRTYGKSGPRGPTY